MKKVAAIVSILFVHCVSFGLHTVARANGAPPEHFVVAEGDHLKVDDHQFYFNAASNDHLYYWSELMVNDVLEDAKGLGLTAFRIWASSEGQDAIKTTKGTGYYFQPNPGQYDEATFQNLDYIIAKARSEGLRLIIPFVNNWDDGYGGMPQYTEWSVSAKSDLFLSLYNPGTACEIAVALRTGSGWDWHEARPYTLQNGWNEVRVYPQTPAWKSSASGWNYSSPVANLHHVRQLSIVLYTSNGVGSIYLDNVRLGPSGRAILWDKAEELDNEPQESWEQGLWRPETGNDATSVVVSTDHYVQGARSLRLDFNPTLPNNKAIWKKDTTMANHDVFYFDSYCKMLYKNYVSQMLNRTNKVTNVKYVTDPTILMWELANEPRCESDTSGDTLRAWVDEMGAYIKNIDPYHLLSTGEEGYYKKPPLTDWRHDGRVGTDFIRNNSSPYIDICSFHLYPEGYQLEDPSTLALDWIQEHIDDARDIIGKPLYLGEFGITADRKAKILNDFNTSAQGWSIDERYAGGPDHVEDLARDGNGSIRYTANISETSTTNLGRIVYNGSGVDYSAYDYLSGWVYIPEGAPADLTCQMYLRTNTGWTWAAGRRVSLVPGTWVQAKVTAQEISGAGADMTKVRCLGIQIERGATDYSGSVYYDLIGANLKDKNDAADQMSRRNKLYEAWYGRLDSQNVSGAAFWQLLAHRDDGSLFPDYWNWGVYYPEDATTSAIIQNYSNKMKDKRLALQIPDVPVATEGEKLKFTLSAIGPSGGDPVLTASDLPSGAVFKDNGDGTALFSWTPGYGQAAAAPYVVRFGVSDGFLSDSGDVSIAVQNVLVFGAINQKLPGGDVPLEGASVSVLNTSLTHVLATAPTDGLGRYKIITPVGTIPARNYIMRAEKGAYSTYSGVAFLRDTQALPFMVALYPPAVAAFNDPALSENQPISVTLSVTDKNTDDKLAFTATGLPAGSVFIDNGDRSATFTWTPSYAQAGQYPVLIKVTDGLFSDEKTMTVTVENAPASDLTVSSLRAIFTNQFVCVFLASVSNKGEDASGPFSILWRVDNRAVKSVKVPNIKAGGSAYQLLITRLARGTHTVGLIADASNRVVETDEKNNNNQIQIVVK